MQLNPLAPDRYNPKNTRRRRTIVAVIVLALLIIGLAVGLGVGLTRHNNDQSIQSPANNGTGADGTAPVGNNTSGLGPGTNGTWWKPKAKTTWQIVLFGKLNRTEPADLLGVNVYDIDLFDNSAQTIQKLHNDGKRVI